MKPHLVHIFPAFAGGGPEVRTAEIINQSADRFEHTVLSLSGEVSGGSRLNPAVDCEAAVCPSLWAMSQAIRSRRPDLVLTYGWGGTDAISAARLAGFRRVVHTEDGFLDDEVDRQKWKRQWARRVIFKAAGALVVPSLRLCDIAREKWRITGKRLRYIPNGIDVDRFSPANDEQRRQSRREWGIPDDALVVGIVGALRPEKNQMRLLNAFAEIGELHPSAWLMIVGDGPLRASLEQVASERGIKQRTTLTGSVQNTERCYHAMDILGLSSDTEQMPLTVLEGMSAGLPVVSTDVGDVRAMVSEENRRWVVPCDRPAELAAGLSAMLSAPELRRALGAANRRRCVADFAWRVMLQAYLDLYAEFSTKRPMSEGVAALKASRQT